MKTKRRIKSSEKKEMKTRTEEKTGISIEHICQTIQKIVRNTQKRKNRPGADSDIRNIREGECQIFRDAGATVGQGGGRLEKGTRTNYDVILTSEF